MPKFNPATIILDIDENPVKDGQIADSAARARINALRVKLAKASEAEQPDLQEEIRLAIEEAQTPLTVGRAMLSVLTNPLPDPEDKTGKRQEDLSGEEKTDLMMLAIKIKQAMNDGESVSLSEKDMKTVKSRVSRGYPSPQVVGRVFSAIKQESAES